MKKGYLLIAVGFLYCMPGSAQSTWLRIYTILNVQCGSSLCHGAGNPMGFNVDATPSALYASMVNQNPLNPYATDSAGNKLIVPFDPARSFLMRKLAYCFTGSLRLHQPFEGPLMPEGAPALPDSTLELIYAWILAGAPEQGNISTDTVPGHICTHNPYAQYTFDIVYDILRTNCADAGCHSGVSPASGLNLSGTKAQVYSAIVEAPPSNFIASGKGDMLIDKGYPERSFLLRKIAHGLSDDLLLTTGEGASEPNGRAKLADYEIELIRQWILHAAPDTGIVTDYQLLIDYYTFGGRPQISRPPAPLPGQGFQIHFGPVFLAPEAEFEYSKKHHPKLPQEMDIYGISVNMNAEGYRAGLSKYLPGSEQNYSDGLLITNLAFESDKEYVCEALNDGDIQLPSGAAFFWDENTVLNIIYRAKNYDPDEILPCELYLNIWSDLRSTSTVEMKTSVISNNTLFILNNSQPLSFSEDVTAPGETWSIWKLTTSTHKYGVDYDIFLRNSNGSLGSKIYEGFYDPSYSFNQGFYNYESTPVRYFDPLLQVNMNDGLIHAASYVNSGPVPVTFGLTNNDEHMIMIAQYTLEPVIAPEFLLTGNIFSETGIPVSGAHIHLLGPPNNSAFTDANGFFNFEIESGSYDLIPLKENDNTASNGISLLDVLMVRRHTLGVALLSSPYKIIAADVDGSDTITTNDVALMRAIILQSISVFPSGNLWTFVTSDHLFPDPQDPFPFPATRYINNINSNLSGLDFIGMKLGDVNNSWDPNIPRMSAAGLVEFALDEHSVKPGEEIVIPVKANDFNNMLGCQFTVSWDAEVLELLDVTGKSLDFLFGLQNVSGGYLTALWEDETAMGRTLNDESEVLELKFKAIGANGTQSEVRIGSELTASEAYDGNLDLIEIRSINGLVKVDETSAISNGSPDILNLNIRFDPSGNSVIINFNMRQASLVRIALYNLEGRRISLFSHNSEKGENRVVWNNSLEYLNGGLYLVKLTTEGHDIGSKTLIIR